MTYTSKKWQFWLLLIHLLPAFTAWAQPRISLQPAAGQVGDTVAVDVFFTAEGEDVAGMSFSIEYASPLLEFDGCTVTPGNGLSGACTGENGRITFIGISLQLQPVPDGQLASVQFRLAESVPGPSTFVLEVTAEEYSSVLAEEIPPGIEPSLGFVQAIMGGEPTAVDRFEPDNRPLTAKQSDSAVGQSDTHWFESPDDEDWILVPMGEGSFQFDVCSGLCGDGGEITPNAQIYGSARVTDPSAEPLAEYNACEGPNSVLPGSEIIGAESPPLAPNQVYLIRIRDCFGLNGPDFPYDLFLTVANVEQQASKISGVVSDSLSGDPIGAYLFVSSDQVTASDPADGAYQTVVEAGVDLQLTLMSDAAPTQAFSVPPLADNEVRTVDLSVLTNAIFSNSFESESP